METEVPVTKIVDVFTIRVVYKSGYVHDFQAFYFSYQKYPSLCKWQAVDHSNKPLVVGSEEIESVWQIGTGEMEVPVDLEIQS